MRCNIWKWLAGAMYGERTETESTDGRDGYSFAEEGAIAIGGKGGRGEKGRGGNGGDAIAVGKNSVAIGGKGGDAT